MDELAAAVLVDVEQRVDDPADDADAGIVPAPALVVGDDRGETSRLLASSVWDTSKSVRHLRIVSPGSPERATSPPSSLRVPREGPRVIELLV